MSGGELALNIVTYCLVGILVGYISWAATAAHRLITSRTLATPPRTSHETELAMGQALGRPMAVWITAVSLGFVFWSVSFALTDPLWGIPFTIVVVVATFFNLWIAQRAFQSKR